MAKKKPKPKKVYLREEELGDGDDRCWVIGEDKEEIVGGADEGDEIYEAVLVSLGKVRRTVSLD